MQELECMEPLRYIDRESYTILFQEESSYSLTLMDLFAALCEETQDDKLVAAAVIHLFRQGYVKFREERKNPRLVWGEKR